VAHRRAKAISNHRRSLPGRPQSPARDEIAFSANLILLMNDTRFDELNDIMLWKATVDFGIWP